MLPCVMNCLVPFSTYSFPCFLARVVNAPASDPLPGSESAYAATFSPAASGGHSRFFCSSVPATRIGYEPSACTARISEELANALAISSMPMQIVTLEPDMPPYSSGKGMPRIPFSANSFSMSFGYSPLRSISAARGATRSWTSSRIVSLMATCSGVNSKSISAGLSGLQQIPGDHDPLHLVGTLVDLERFRVEDVSFEWASGAGAVFAGALHCVQRNLHPT